MKIGKVHLAIRHDDADANLKVKYAYIDSQQPSFYAIVTAA